MTHTLFMLFFDIHKQTIFYFFQVLVDSFQGLGIRTSDYESGFEPSLSSLSSPSSPRDSFLFKDCSVGSGRPSSSIR